MAAYSTTDMLFQESERVRDKIEEWVNRFDTPANLIPKREVQKVSERDFPAAGV